jgi:hypothetical protein
MKEKTIAEQAQELEYYFMNRVDPIFLNKDDIHIINLFLQRAFTQGMNYQITELMNKNTRGINN